MSIIKTEKPQLSPPSGMNEHLKEATGGQVFRIDYNTTIIDVQPMFTHIKELPDNRLQDHQAALKVTAKTWQSDVRPTLMHANDAVLAYSIKFDSMFEPLFKYADKIIGTKKDDPIRLRMIRGIEKLVKDANVQMDATQNAAIKLRTFHNEMNAHKALFDEDHKTISRAIADKNDMLEKLVSELEDANRRSEEGKRMMTGGSIATFIIFMPVVSIVAASVLIAGAVQKDKAQKSVNDLTRQINDINASMAIVITIENQVTQLVGAIGQIVKDVSGLSNAWNQLVRSYDVYKKAIESDDFSTDESDFVKASLNEAKQKWKEVADVSRDIRDKQLTPPRVYISQQLEKK